MTCLLSGSLSGACRESQVNPTFLRRLLTTTWTRFVGNVGFHNRREIDFAAHSIGTNGLEGCSDLEVTC